ncbi:helix-turn-helix transcriptional regulator [Geotalea uraniireducens]|uniref:helix-turn-helix transcriptional regulator n=1 Tax=Geotalea uraniireducens TaxID=351604 RepID=UPI003D7EC761
MGTDGKILSRREVAALLGVGASTIRRLELAGELPPRVQVSPRRIGYFSSEIEKFLKQLPRVGKGGVR